MHTYKLSTKFWRWVNDETIGFNDISAILYLRYNPGKKTTIIEEISAFHANLLACRCGTLCFRTTEPSRVFCNFWWECHTLMCPRGGAGCWLDARVTSTTRAHPATRAGIDSLKWSWCVVSQVWFVVSTRWGKAIFSTCHTFMVGAFVWRETPTEKRDNRILSCLLRGCRRHEL